MPLLQVRDCQKDIYQKNFFACQKTEQNDRTENHRTSGKSLGQYEPDIERRRQLLDRIINREIAATVKEIDAVALIREDRER